jgi:hypothetical protein
MMSQDWWEARNVRNAYFGWTYQGIGAEVPEGKKQGLRSGERDKGRIG